MNRFLRLRLSSNNYRSSTLRRRSSTLRRFVSASNFASTAAASKGSKGFWSSYGSGSSARATASSHKSSKSVSFLGSCSRSINWMYCGSLRFINVHSHILSFLRLAPLAALRRVQTLGTAGGCPGRSFENETTYVVAIDKNAGQCRWLWTDTHNLL